MALHHDPLWPRAGTWFASSMPAESAQTDVALLGIGTHLLGITPNNSHLTPAAIRDALMRYSTWSTSSQIDFAEMITGQDLGDVKDPEDESKVKSEVTFALSQTDFLIALGGDNSLTFPAVLGFAEVHGGLKNIGVITLDAHHDIREGTSNGSPIRRLIEAGLPGHQIAQIGISDFANSKIYANRVRDYGIHVIDRSAMRRRTLAEIAAVALEIAGGGNRSIYIDIDMDVCDRSAVPACPAATPGGISADELRQLSALLGRDARVKMIDITEIDSSMDAPDGRTVRLAAMCILEIATARAQLKG